MRLLIQVVKEAAVKINGKITGSIGQGLLIFFGAHIHDALPTTERMAEKVSNLRILPDSDEKMNLSIKDTGGEVLIVSQFTLYADCSHGRRPSFTHAASPAFAKDLYDQFVTAMRARVKTVETGIFGEMMAVSLINNGPLTFIIDSEDLK